jgi:hypothetical protein
MKQGCRVKVIEKEKYNVKELTILKLKVIAVDE